MWHDCQVSLINRKAIKHKSIKPDLYISASPFAFNQLCTITKYLFNLPMIKDKILLK